ncbi:MAG: DUF2846 domain-containing protein [Pseudomonadota bacterium]
MVAVICLSGCAPYLAPPTKADATVYVLNTIPDGSVEAHALLVNGKEIAALASRQYTWFQVSPGTYSFAVAGGRDQGGRQSALELNLKPGVTRYLVYDEEEQDNYLIEYAQDHANRWLQGARYVRNSVPR